MSPGTSWEKPSEHNVLFGKKMPGTSQSCSKSLKPWCLSAFVSPGPARKERKKKILRTHWKRIGYLTFCYFSSSCHQFVGFLLLMFVHYAAAMVLVCHDRGRDISRATDRKWQEEIDKIFRLFDTEGKGWIVRGLNCCQTESAEQLLIENWPSIVTCIISWSFGKEVKDVQKARSLCPSRMYMAVSTLEGSTSMLLFVVVSLQLYKNLGCWKDVGPLQVCKELGERLTNEEITEIVRRACQDEPGPRWTFKFKATDATLLWAIPFVSLRFFRSSPFLVLSV